MDLASFAMQMTPEQRQALMGQILQRRQQSDQLAGASARAHSMDMPAAAALMANNPELAAAAKLQMGSAQKMHSPVQMGNQGFALPSTGEFVSSPMYEQEQSAAREGRRDIAEAGREASLQRTRELIASREREGEQGRSLRMAIAALVGSRARDKESGKPKGKTLPAGVIDKMTTKQTLAMDFSDLETAFKEEYGGSGFDTVDAAQNFLGKNQPLGFGEQWGDKSNWWQNYNDKKNIIRNQLFGSALTATEQAAFDKANITEGMHAEEIRRRLGQQRSAATRAYNKLKTAYGKGGYDISNFEDLPDFSPTAKPGGNPTKPTSKPPKGVEQNVWDAMTEQEKALWKN